MSFGRPAVLALLPLLLLLLWALRRVAARRRVVVTAHLLFRRAAAAVAELPRRRRPRHRDIVRLLPAALAIVALAAPALERERARRVVVVIDRSPSMATDPGGGSRLRRGLAALPSGLGEVERAGVPPPAHPGLVTRPGARRPTDAELVRAVAARLVSGRRCVLVTDRALSGLPGAAGLVRVSDGALNGGITAAAMDQEGRLLVRGVAEAPRVLRVVSDGARPPASLELAPGPFRHVVEGTGGARRIVVRLDPPDANPTDDVVELLPPPLPPRIGLPARGREHLERAFLADPGLHVVRGPGAADLRVGAGGGPRRVTLLVAPVAAGPLRTADPRPVSGTLAPLGALGDLPLGAERFHGAVHSLADPPADVEVLLEAGGVPLLVRSGATLVLLHDPAAGSWRDRRSFPIVVTELARRAVAVPSAAPAAHRGGTVVHLPVPPGAPADVRAAVELPGGGEVGLAPGTDGTLRLQLGVPGVHVVRLEGAAGEAPGWPVRVSCAVLDEAATRARPADTAAVRPPAPAAAAPSRRVGLDPWLYAAALLALLVIEGLPLVTSRGVRSSAGRAPA